MNKEIKNITIEYEDGSVEQRTPNKSRIYNLIKYIANQKRPLNIKLSKQDIIDICEFTINDKEYKMDISYLANWLRSFKKQFSNLNDIRINLRSKENLIYITSE